MTILIRQANLDDASTIAAITRETLNHIRNKRVGDLMVENEYERPDVYHAEYGLYKGDFPFFLDIVSSGAALDLACGTGRMSRALATTGIEVTGLDMSQEMIEFARTQKSSFPIQYVQGDIRSFSLNRQFDLVTIAGNSFQALLSQEDQMSFLSCVKSHLKGGGYFAFNMRTPNAEKLATTTEFEYWHSFTDLAGRTVRVFGTQDYNAKQQIITYNTKRVWPDHETTSVVSLRFSTPESVFSLLRDSGFRILHTFGTPGKTPYTPGDKNLYILCQGD